jgi:hypothetical protein
MRSDSLSGSALSPHLLNTNENRDGDASMDSMSSIDRMPIEAAPGTGRN